MPPHGQDDTQQFWALATTSVIIDEDNTTDASRRAKVRAQRQRASQRGHNAVARKIEAVPSSLRTFHTKRWDEWRPTRSNNDWGNPLKQHHDRRSVGYADERVPRSHVAFSANPRRAKLRREEAHVRAVEKARVAAEKAERERLEALARIKPPKPPPYKWNWPHPS